MRTARMIKETTAHTATKS